MRRFFLVLALLLAPVVASAQARDPARFQPEFDAFAQADRERPPPRCPIVFTGSSTIRRWTTLSLDMAPLSVLNRGFGGSTVADVDFWFDQAVARYRPRAIFFYAGDNDLAAGKTPGEVVADFRRFMDLKDKALGRTPVWFISVKPSKLRFDQMPQQSAVNAAVRKLADERADLDYIDVVPAMLSDG